MYEKLERKLIKQDAKLVIMQNWKMFLVVSLPVILLTLMMEFRRIIPFMNSKIFAGITVLLIVLLIVLFYMPATFCQNEAILKKLRQEDFKVSSVFHWLNVPSYWWAAMRLFLAYMAIAVILILVISIVLMTVALNSDVFSHLAMSSYYKGLISVIGVIGSMMVSIFTVPAINMLVSNPTAKTWDVVKSSVRFGTRNFKSLFVFVLTLLFLFVSVYVLNWVATANLFSFLEANPILINCLYTLVGCILYLITFYLNFYINTAMLSYVDLLLAREDTKQSMQM